MSSGPTSIRISVENLRRSLRNLRIFQDFDYNGIIQGYVEPLISIIRFVLVEYEPSITNHLVTGGYEILGQSNSRILESWFKILREILNYRPTISISQFNSKSFMVKKIEIIIYFLKQLPDLLKQVKRSNGQSLGDREASRGSISRKTSLCEIKKKNNNDVSEKESVRSFKSFRSDKTIPNEPKESPEKNRRSRSSSETRMNTKRKKSTTSSIPDNKINSEKITSLLHSHSHPKIHGSTRSLNQDDEYRPIVQSPLISASTHGRFPSSGDLKEKYTSNRNEQEKVANSLEAHIPPFADILMQLTMKVDQLSTRISSLEVSIERISNENEYLHTHLAHDERAHRNNTIAPSSYYQIMKENTIASPKYFNLYDDINNNTINGKGPQTNNNNNNCGLIKSTYQPLKCANLLHEDPTANGTKIPPRRNSIDMKPNQNSFRNEVKSLSEKPPLPSQGLYKANGYGNDYNGDYMNGNGISALSETYQAQVS